MLTWTGQFRAVMWLSALTAAFLPLGMLLSAHYGLVAVAWCWAIVFPLTTIPAFVLSFRTLGITVAAWIRSMQPAMVACIGMVVTVIAARMLITGGLSDRLSFLIQVSIGAGTYIVVLWFGFRGRVQFIVDTIKAARR